MPGTRTIGWGFWTDRLGKPQGNESVQGKLIVREVSLSDFYASNNWAPPAEVHRFRILWSFNSQEEAEKGFRCWLKEYAMSLPLIHQSMYADLALNIKD